MKKQRKKSNEKDKPKRNEDIHRLSNNVKNMTMK